MTKLVTILARLPRGTFCVRANTGLFLSNAYGQILPGTRIADRRPEVALRYIARLENCTFDLVRP